MDPQQITYSQPDPFAAWATNLNSGADRVLEHLASYGRYYDALQSFPSDPPWILTQSASNVNSAVETLRAADIQRTSAFTSLPESYVQTYYSGRYSEGYLGPIMGKIGGVFDAATGILSTFSALNQDRLVGDLSYSGTMSSIARSVGQTATGFAAGGATALGVSSLLGGVGTAGAGAGLVAGAPFVAAVAVAGTAGYLAGKFFDWIRG